MSEPRVVTAVLDRFEAAMAVFEDRESGDLVHVPRVTLPTEARPGDWARLEVGARPRVLAWLPGEREEKDGDLAALRDLLRARRRMEP